MDNKFLSNIIENAFDFLEKSIEQFKKEPKYSVIHFCAAIELILKARLMHEHWSLIVSAKDPNIKAFKSGNFKSLGFKDLIPRIKAVTGEVIHVDTIVCFQGLANHRNKMIHFFHETQNKKESTKLLTQIAIEQSKGWFFLGKLLKKWDFIFKSYEDRIQTIDYRIKTHDIYLDTVFKQISSDISKAKQQGAIFKECVSCKKEASQEIKHSKYLYEYKCQVCLFVENSVRIPCQNDDCNCEIEVTEDYTYGTTCLSCGHAISNEELAAILDTNPVTKDNYVDHTQKNCALCHSLGSVVEHYDYFICTKCLSIEKHVNHCGWCNESQMGGGDLEWSYYTGCEFCDGNAGWTKDDD